MIIEVNRISPEGSEYSGEESASILDAAPGSVARFCSPLHYELKAILVSRELIVTGSLTLDAAFLCSRCGETFPLQVREPAFECVREVADANESVDLTPDIRESMLLALPSYPVCSPGCKGLCAQCGANWNRGPCGCRPREASGWEALERLSKKNA